MEGNILKRGMRAVIEFATHTPFHLVPQSLRGQAPGTCGSLEINAQMAATGLPAKRDHSTCQANCSPRGFRKLGLAMETCASTAAAAKQ